MLDSLIAIAAMIQGATIAVVTVLAFGFTVTFVADRATRAALIGGATRRPFLWLPLEFSAV